MNFTITPLTPAELNSFFPVFEEVLSHEFEGYSKNIVRYLLTHIYSPANYKYWLENNLKIILVARCHPELVSGSDSNQMLKPASQRGEQIQHDNDPIVGFTVIDEPYGGVSLCRWLGVLKTHQKQGIGTALIQEWIKLARSQKCHKAELAAMPSAKIFYEKVGLELEGLRKLSYFGTDQYVFGKVLGEINEISIIR